jgi:hypothetical protein
MTSDSTAVAGVRIYAAGRRRNISTPGADRTFQITAVNVERPDFDELVSRVGSVQTMREPRGQRAVGVLGGIGSVEWKARTTVGTLTFTITETTSTEIV